MTDQQHDGDTGHHNQPALAQRLPNECLYLIVNHLQDDLRTLHTLLFVNRFFFHAALPLVMDDPFGKWGMNSPAPKFTTCNHKLFVLLLASLLHHQQDALARKNASSILAEFGLQLVQSTEFPVLQPLLHSEAEEHDGIVWRRSLMTVNYSKYMLALKCVNKNDWYYVDLHRIVQLIEVLEGLRSELYEESDSDLEEDSEEDGGRRSGEAQDVNGHSSWLQERDEYKDAVFDRINWLLLHYSTEHITYLPFHISKAGELLLLAPRLASLRTIVLGTIQDSREFMCACMLSKVELYHAIGEPEELVTEAIPGFYKLLVDLGTERLRRLNDSDLFRIDTGEGPDMEAFLRRCSRLELLGLNAGHPHILSWAAQHAMDRVDGRLLPGSLTLLLPRLENLELKTSRPYCFNIHALNDAMAAFSQTLKKVKVWNGHGFDKHDEEHNQWFRGRDLANSRQIRTAPLASSIGNWPFLLPRLSSISIVLYCVGSLCVGTFDHCPSLEALVLNYGIVSSGPRATEPDDNDPDADPRRQAPLDPSLFPKWSLPKLKSLELAGAPALLFNYDSLETMQSLKKLCLINRTKTDLEDRLQEIPRFSTYTSPFFESLAHENAGEATDGDIPTSDTFTNSTAPVSRPSGNEVWRGTWTLPRLESMMLQGAPATAFSFNLLKSFPSLESLILNLPHPGPRQRLPLVAFTPVSPDFPLASAIESNLSDSILGDSSNNDDMVWKCSRDTRAFMESKLERLTLCGPWVFTAPDIVGLLSEYAPFLKALVVLGTRGDESSTPRVLKGFQGADEIMRRRYGPAWDARTEGLDNKQRPPPGRSLIEVSSSFNIQLREPLPLESMVRLDENDEDADTLRQRGVRVLELNRRVYVVDKQDKAWYDCAYSKDQ
ncbi:hypothetical protein BGW39_007980 [Mortierella sp. 14UC]|nr:hypothetical protein BGW39_007980 [Mortierella sp. 14UC]